eukprot:CAMPEP_0198138976 /NCGR_PEP_ID=MMETSP1443-20131203/2319_1 /TAXON_ID=186043 /ORGANISM="Entomoneis sp., Strain CCMP2396" /LENGTH=294 /DNA_ID=CAMNT_0043800935 /DNA_START=282 /DNA_END=1163 /DNA_ORIENTATION=+
MPSRNEMPTTTDGSSSSSPSSSISSSALSSPSITSVSEEVLTDCRNVLSLGFNKGFSDLVWNIPKCWWWFVGSSVGTNNRGAAAALYTEEAALMHDALVEPLMQSITMTFLVFGTLRVGNSRFFSDFWNFYYGHAMEPMANHITETKIWQAHLKRHTAQKGGGVPNWIVETLVSMAAGVSSFAYFHNRRDIYRSMSQAPLLPGKSVVHETTCAPILEAVQQIRQSHGLDLNKFDTAVQLQKDFHINTNASDNYSVMLTHVLAHNCQLRNKYLEKSNNNHIKLTTTVPYPGIKGK